MSTAVMIVSSILLLPAAVATAPDEMPGLGPIAAVAALGVPGRRPGMTGDVPHRRVWRCPAPIPLDFWA
jgi:hypothetical protein